MSDPKRKILLRDKHKPQYIQNSYLSDKELTALHETYIRKDQDIKRNPQRQSRCALLYTHMKTGNNYTYWNFNKCYIDIYASDFIPSL